MIKTSKNIEINKEEELRNLQSAKMARMELKYVLTILALLICSWTIPTCAAKKLASVSRKEDVPYIKCQVCEKLATQLYQQVKKKEAQVSPRKISEYEIIEISENVCNLKKAEGDWILQIDIVKKGDALELVEQGTEGQCNSQCKTIERACQEVMGYSDTDVSEYIFKSKPQIDELVKFLCKDLIKVCSIKAPPVPKDWVAPEPFVPKSSSEAEMDKILKSMEGIPGAPSMKMYSRDDLLNMKNFGDEDADEDNEERDFPSKLGKVLREKQSAKEDWKQKITKRIADTGVTLKSHANKLSRRIRQWWQGKKSVSSKNSPKVSKREL